MRLLGARHHQASGQTKEDLARGIAERDGITEGLVCVLRIVEPCRSFDLRRNHASHQLEVISRERKCVHLYWYFIDPELGFIHVPLHGLPPKAWRLADRD